MKNLTRFEKAVALTAVLLFLFSLTLHAQIISIGPIGQPPIDPKDCKPLDQQTGLCFAKDGVHVSLAGGPFGDPLPAAGPKGDPGANGLPGKDGAPGAPGKDAIFPQNVILTCSPSQGTVNKGFTAKCTVTVSQ